MIIRRNKPQKDGKTYTTAEVSCEKWEEMKRENRHHDWHVINADQIVPDSIKRLPKQVIEIMKLGEKKKPVEVETVAETEPVIEQEKEEKKNYKSKNKNE